MLSVLLLICSLSAPVVLDPGVYIAGVSVETNTGPMILTSWHAVKPYYQRGKVHFKILPGNYYASIIEYNDSYDVCWLRPHAEPNDPNIIGHVSKGDTIVQEHAAKSKITGKAGEKYADVQAKYGVKWHSAQEFRRIAGGYLGPGCSGAPVYKDDKLVGLMVGFVPDGKAGYFVPMESLLNKNGIYRQTKTPVKQTIARKSFVGS